MAVPGISGPRPRSALLGAAVLASFTSGPGSAALRAQSPDAATVAARLRAHLEATEPALGMLVADERFEQRITTVAENGTPQTPTRRTLISEIGFARLSDDHAWLGHRRVQSINGRPVRDDAPRLSDLFAGSDPTQQLAAARAIADENARHNLGHPRTTNVPTLPLDLLHPRHQAAYSLAGARFDRRGTRAVPRLNFHEGRKGTVVAYDEGSFVRTLVTAWVDAETGGLERADVTLIPPIAARENHVVRVDFETHPALGLRVPVRLTERFWAGGTGEGQATYSNYRRFETAARVKP